LLGQEGTVWDNLGQIGREWDNFGQAESRQQLATKKQEAPKVNKRRQLATTDDNWRQESQRRAARVEVMRLVLEHKGSGALSGIFGGKCPTTKELHCGAFEQVAPQTRHNQK